MLSYNLECKTSSSTDGDPHEQSIAGSGGQITDILYFFNASLKKILIMVSFLNLTQYCQQTFIIGDIS